MYREAADNDLKNIQYLHAKYNASKKRNAATAKGKIAGKLIDLEAVSGRVNPVNPQNNGNFTPPKDEYFKGPENFSEHTEQKIVEYLREKYQKTPNIEGSIELISERPYCNNSNDVVDQFQKEFKNVEVIRVEVLPKE